MAKCKSRLFEHKHVVVSVDIGNVFLKKRFKIAV